LNGRRFALAINSGIIFIFKKQEKPAGFSCFCFHHQEAAGTTTFLKMINFAIGAFYVKKAVWKRPQTRPNRKYNKIDFR